MLVHLAVRDFRNLGVLELPIPPAGLAVVGENGQGKTNLLEAVAYLGQLRSVRGARDADVVRFGAPGFHVRGTRAPGAVPQVVGVGYERAGRQKRVTVDGVEAPRLASALGAVPSVGFSPADVALVAGGPGERRRYLDVLLALTVPGYLAALQRYRGALERRNAVLRAGVRSGRATVAAEAAAWEPVLAETGARLAGARAAFVARHAAALAEACAAIGEAQPVAMRYVGGEGDYLAAFAQQRDAELRRGVTLVGPHRDDLAVQLGGRELRTFGSNGQQRSAAIALRLVELAAMTAALGAPPLLLLDDPFAELDAGRAARVLALLDATPATQLLVAVPRAEEVPAAWTRLERRTMWAGAVA
jgi:DNA replication and repair protein RecF